VMIFVLLAIVLAFGRVESLSTEKASEFFQNWRKFHTEYFNNPNRANEIRLRALYTEDATVKMSSPDMEFHGDDILNVFRGWSQQLQYWNTHPTFLTTWGGNNIFVFGVNTGDFTELKEMAAVKAAFYFHLENGKVKTMQLVMPSREGFEVISHPERYLQPYTDQAAAGRFLDAYFEGCHVDIRDHLPSAIDSFLDPHVSGYFLSPAGPAAFHGIEEHRRNLKNWYQVIEAARFTTSEFVADHKSIFGHAVGSAKFKSGCHLQFDFGFMYEVKDGKMTKYYEFWDEHAFDACLKLPHEDL